MKEGQVTFPVLAIKAVVSHTITYFLVGLLAFTVFNYAAQYAEPGLSSYMRSTDDPIVALGPALQPVRGLLFALAFWPLREVLFGRKRGWLVTWMVLVLLGILSTFGPAPASVEGLIYTRLPALEQFGGGFLEILAQSFLFSGLLYYWINHPEKRWISWVLGTGFVLVVAMSLAGFFLA